MPTTRSMIRKSASSSVVAYHEISGQKLASSKSFRKLDQMQDAGFTHGVRAGLKVSENKTKNWNSRCFRSSTKYDFGETNTRQFRNKLAPFWTMEKPTCGVKFSRETNNRRKKLDIEPSNLVRWRRNY